MALPNSGTISMRQVIEEIDGPVDDDIWREISLGNTKVRDLADIASGTISMDDLHGKTYKLMYDIYMNSGTYNAGGSIDNFIEMKGYSNHLRFGSVSPRFIGDPEGDGGNINSFHWVYESRERNGNDYDDFGPGAGTELIEQYVLGMDRVVGCDSVTVITLKDGFEVGTLPAAGSSFVLNVEPQNQDHQGLYEAMRDGGHIRLVFNYN